MDYKKEDVKLHGFLSLSNGYMSSYRHWLCNPSHRSPPECLLCGYIGLGHFLPVQLLYIRAALGVVWSLLEHGLVYLRIQASIYKNWVKHCNAWMKNWQNCFNNCLLENCVDFNNESIANFTNPYSTSPVIEFWEWVWFWLFSSVTYIILYIFPETSAAVWSKFL